MAAAAAEETPKEGLEVVAKMRFVLGRQRLVMTVIGWYELVDIGREYVAEMAKIQVMHWIRIWGRVGTWKER